MRTGQGVLGSLLVKVTAAQLPAGWEGHWAGDMALSLLRHHRVICLPASSLRPLNMKPLSMAIPTLRGCEGLGMTRQFCFFRVFFSVIMTQGPDLKAWYPPLL